MRTLEWELRVDNRKPFCAGDSVLHVPSGESWLLIADESDGVVVPGGWPDTRASARDCILNRAASYEERLAQLRVTADSKHSARGLATAQLEALGFPKK